MSTSAENTDGGKLKRQLINPIKDVFTGRFLVSPQLAQQWPYIIYLSFLALIMIASSHKADKKVHKISKLRSQMKELNSEYIDTRSTLMIQSMEYKVVEKGEALGLEKSSTPPVLIKSETED